MPLNRPALKRRAVEIMAEYRPRVLLVGLVYLLLVMLMEWLQMRVLSVNISQTEAMNYLNYVAEGNYESALPYIDSMMPPTSAGVISLMLTLVTRVVAAGFLIFLLNTVRQTAPAYANLLDGFGNLLRILLLNILIAALVSFWSLLLVVPGIIARYRYSQAIYILLDDPTKSPFRCLRESSAMMKVFSSKALNRSRISVQLESRWKEGMTPVSMQRS